MGDYLEPLEIREGLYYRLHRFDHPFGPEHALTLPRVPDGYQPPVDDERFDLRIPKRGYSSFWNPHHIAEYVQEMNWEPDDARVIAFYGVPVGEGYDGEPRVMPADSRIIEEIPWDDFLDRLEVTPNGYGRWHEHTWGDGPDGRIVDDGYRTMAELAREHDQDTPGISF